VKAAQRSVRFIVLALVVSLCIGLPTLAAAAPSLDLSKGIGGDVPFASGLPSCQIGKTAYKTLASALKATPKKTPTTIKLLGNITSVTPCAIENKRITFDLNGYNLVFKCVDGNALTLTNSDVDYVGKGTLQAISVNKTGLSMTGGSCKLTYAESEGGHDGEHTYCAIYCCYGAKVTLNGSAKMPDGVAGVCVEADYQSSVIVNGTITASGNTTYGLWALGGSTVVVNGDVVTSCGGVDAYNVSNAHGPDNQPYNGPTKVMVNGNIAVDNYGVYATGGSTSVHVTGRVTSKTEAGVSVGFGAQVTVDGAIAASHHYIEIVATNRKTGADDPAPKTAADFRSPTTKAGYKTYSDGQSTVWVGNAPAQNADQTGASAAGSVSDAGSSGADAAGSSESSSSAAQAAGQASESQKSPATSSRSSRVNTKILAGIIAGVLFVTAAVIITITVRRSKKQPIP